MAAATGNLPRAARAKTSRRCSLQRTIRHYLVLAAVHHRDRGGLLGNRGGPAGLLEHRADLFGVDQGFADIAVVHRHVEGDQAIAMLAIGLKTRTHPLRALAEDLRALRAFDSDFVVDHDAPGWKCRI